MSVAYIQRITLEPFQIIMFTDEQFTCLQILCQDGKEIDIFLDATGGIVSYAGKVIYYYAEVTRDFSIPLIVIEKRSLLPLFECLTAAHDTYNISLILRQYKHHFHMRFPTLKWPIKRAVSDMSYATLNSICHSWNNMKLIDFINLIYEAANNSIDT